MAKQELEYGSCKTIANKVEAMILNIGSHDALDIAEDFLDFLMERSLDEYWSGAYTISSVFTDAGPNIGEGVKFEFVRLVGTKSGSEPSSMGVGTQWLSDVVGLMKDYLKEGKQNWFKKSKLVFRIDDKQFEWG